MKKQYTYGNATFETLDALFEEVKKTLATAEEGITTLIIGVETARTWDDVVADVIAYFEDNDDDFIEVIEALDDENGILGEARYHDMEDLDYEVGTMYPSEFLDCIDLYSWDKYDDYFKYEGGELQSFGSKDYTEYLNEDFVNDLFEYYDDMCETPDEVRTLFDDWKGNEEDEADEDDDEDDDNGDE